MKRRAFLGTFALSLYKIQLAPEGPPGPDIPIGIHLTKAPIAEAVEAPGPELPPVALRFDSNDNVVVQFLLTEPGTVFARIIDFPLGTGGVVYSNIPNDRSAIYNVADDRMYFLADRTQGATTIRVLVQYDPRALRISGEIDLSTLPPAEGIGDYFLLEDVADKHAWLIQGGAEDSRVVAIDVTTMTAAFVAPPIALGGITTYDSGFTACGNGQMLTVENAANPVVCHLITITGPTTWTDEPIEVLPLDDDGDLYSANNGSFRRHWIGSKNLVFWNMGYAPNGQLAVLIDLAEMSAIPIMPQAGHTSATFFQPWWDPITNAVVGTYSWTDGAGFHYSIGVFNPDGAFVGVAALDSFYDTAAPAMPLGGSVWSRGGVSEVGYTYDGFDEAIPSQTPSLIFEADSFVSVPNGYDFSQYVCIAPRIIRPSVLSKPAAPLRQMSVGVAFEAR